MNSQVNTLTLMDLEIANIKGGKAETPSSAVQSCGSRRFSLAETRLGVIYTNQRFCCHRSLWGRGRASSLRITQIHCQMGNSLGMGIATRCEIRIKGDESRHITFCIFELSYSLLNHAAVVYFCKFLGNFLSTRLARRSEKGGLYQHGCWRCLNMEVERGQMPTELYLLFVSLSHPPFMKRRFMGVQGTPYLEVLCNEKELLPFIHISQLSLRVHPLFLVSRDIPQWEGSISSI